MPTVFFFITWEILKIVAPYVWQSLYDRIRRIPQRSIQMGLEAIVRVLMWCIPEVQINYRWALFSSHNFVELDTLELRAAANPIFLRSQNLREISQTLRQTPVCQFIWQQQSAHSDICLLSSISLIFSSWQQKERPLSVYIEILADLVDHRKYQTEALSVLRIYT